MAQSINRFGIDEVRTQLTAPTSNVQVQGPLDTSLTTSTRSKGIQNLSASIGNLAKQKLAQKIHNDTIDAQLASAYNREQPEGLEPEAMFAFNKAEDLKLSLKVQQNLDNYRIVEGTEILNDSRLSRKEKLSQFQLGMQAIINTGKQGVTPVNAGEIFPSFEREYIKNSNLAATELAKQKKEEESSTNAVAINSMIDNIYKDQALPALKAVSGENTIVEDDDLNPENYAKLVVQLNKHLSSKGLSVKNFNGIVNAITATKRGADNREIKATVLTSIVGRMLRGIQEGNVTVDPEIVTNLIDSLKGNPQVKGSTLRTEINSGSEYGKIFKTIEDGFTGNIKTILNDKRVTATNNNKIRDNQIGTTVFDAKEGTYTLEEGIQILKGVNDVTKQNSFIKRWQAGFTSKPQNGLATPAYLKALQENVLTENGKEIDPLKLTQVAIDYNLSNTAVTNLSAALDPETKAGKHRTKVLNNQKILLLKTRFPKAVTGYLKNLNVKEMAKLGLNWKPGDPPPTAFALAGLAKQMGSMSPVYNKLSEILNAELSFADQLEDLIIDRPNADPREIADDAEKIFNNLFLDTISGNEPGTAAEAEEVRVINEFKRRDKELEGMVGLGQEGSGAVTTTTLAENLKIVEKKKKEQLSIALKSIGEPEEAKKYIELAAKEVELAQKAVTTAAKFPVATRQERMKIVFDKGGIPKATEAAKRTVAAFKTNPNAFLVIRAKVLQKAAKDKAKADTVSGFARSFGIKTDAEIKKNMEDGNNFFRIGSYQLTMDELKNTPGNVSFFLKDFFGIISEKDKLIKRKELEEASSTETDTRKDTVDKMLDILSPKDAEGAATSQDSDFDPTAKGPRGIGKEGTRNELAKDLGLPPDFSEARFEGGTSEESDIEGFTGEDTGEDVDMPPVVMDEIVISETKPNRAQQRLEAFDKAFPDVPNEKDELRKLQDTAKFKSNKTIVDAAARVIPKVQRFVKDTLDRQRINDLTAAFGADNITRQVENSEDIDPSLPPIIKGFFDDINLKSLWGNSKDIVSLRRTKTNPARKEKSGHNDGTAVDIRTKNSEMWKKGTTTVSENIIKSAKDQGWSVKLTKDKKETVKSSNGNELWTQLIRQNKDGKVVILFLEVVQGSQPHVHFHLGEDKLEPEHSWDRKKV